MGGSRIRKSLVCYRTTLNESELAWKNVVDNSLDTINLNGICDFDDIFQLNGLKSTKCFNKKCSLQIYYKDNVVLKKCTACSHLNCFECLDTHENSCSKQVKTVESINRENNSTQEAYKKVQLATSEMKLHNYVSALIHYSEAIALQPDDAKFLSERCNCLMALGHFETAIDDATKAISLDANCRMSYYAAMDCYLAMGDLIKLENLITQRKDVTSEIDSVDKNHTVKLTELRKLQGDINDFLLSSNYEKVLECIDSSLEIATACEELHLKKMGLHIILKLPVTEKMLESPTNKHIERVCGTNFYDLLQLFYNDNLPLCITTAAKMLKLLPKKLSAIEDIFNRSSRFIEDFEKAEQLYTNKNFSASANILRGLLAVDPSNKAVAERILSKLTEIENLMSDKEPQQNTKYSFTTSKSTDKFHCGANISDEAPNTEKPNTRYSFSASDIKYFKEDIGKPKPTWASIQGEAKNMEGCKAFRNGNYLQAHRLYGQALSMCPNNPKYLTNRSTSSMKLNNFKEALADALKAVEIDKTHVKGYLKAVSVFIILGEISQAERYIDILKENDNLLNSVQFDEISKLNKLKEFRVKIDETYADQNYDECLKCLNNAMKIATHCENFENLKAECLVMVKQYDEAEAMIDALLQKDPKRSYLIFILGLRDYFGANLSRSVYCFEESLRYDPDFTRATNYRNKANTLMRYIAEGELFFCKNLDSLNLGDLGMQEQHEDARRLFSQGLNVDTMNTKVNSEIFYYRGLANYFLEDYKEAYADYTEALQINEELYVALIGRAFTHYNLGEFEDCLIDCEELLKTESFESRNRITELVFNAKQHLKTKKPRSNFSILGVPLNATIDEIKSAFKKLSLQYHSDKSPNATLIDQRKLRRRFQEIKAAYDSLRQSYFF